MADKAVIQFYPLDFEDLGNKIKIFGKTLDGKRITILDDSIKPYFYVMTDNEKLVEKIKKLSVKGAEQTLSVLDAEIIEKNYNENPAKVIKVIVDEQSHIGPISSKISYKYEVKIKENDISLIKRYLVDKSILPLCLCEVKGNLEYLEEGPAIIGEVKQVGEDIINNPTILAFDIEVYGLAGGKDKIKKDPIISVAFADNKGFQKVITWKKFEAEKYVEFVNGEEELIERFVEIVKERNPDFIVGYFSDEFDFPYLRGRAEKYEIKLNLGIDESGVIFKRGGQSSSAKIKGIPHLDLLKFIKNIMSGSLRLDSYSLESVAQELLKEGKNKFDIESIEEQWDTGNIKDLCAYNLQDANLTLKICEKIFPNIGEIVKLIGIGAHEICRMHYGQLVENYLIKRAKDYNEIVPNKPSHDLISDRVGETYQGAFVMEPKPGFYDNIVFLDFMSLYPTIVIAKNISPSTLNKGKGYKTPKIYDEYGNYKEFTFRSEKEAFIPSVLRDIITRRNRIKEMLNKEDKPNPVLKARSYALKTVANSTYGYMGFFGARWYCKECAASITAWARYYIQDVIEKAKKEFNVVYSDTDSIAFTLGKKTEKDAVNFLQKINKELPSLMELELENFYPKGIFVSKKGEGKGAKKKYALIDRKGVMKITGFETIRGDWSLIAKEVQLNVLEIILKENDVEKAKKYVQNVISDIKNKKIPIKKMLIKTQLRLRVQDYKQIGPHVAVARRLKESGIYVSQGTNILYVITEGDGMIRDRAKLLKECREDDYDSSYYIENQVIPSVEKIFEIFDIKKEDLMHKEQSKLGDF